MRNPLKYKAKGRVTVEYQAYNDLKHDHVRENAFRSFEEFIDAVGTRPKKGHMVLRRHDTSKPYQSGNVFWGKRDVSPSVRARILTSLIRKGLKPAPPVNERRHGMTGTAEFRALQCAKQRCYNPHNDDYKNYGAKGVRVLFRSFAEFFKCLGSRPPGATLDRVNPYGCYVFGNVRWADSRQQHDNQRANLANLLYCVLYEVLLDEGMSPAEASAQCMPIPAIECLKSMAVSASDRRGTQKRGTKTPEAERRTAA